MKKSNIETMAETLIKLRETHNVLKYKYEGLTWHKYIILFIIRGMEYDKRTMRGIQRQLNTTIGNIQTIIHYLEDNGYVEKEKRSNAYYYSLTGKGEKVLKQINT